MRGSIQEPPRIFMFNWFAQAPRNFIWPGFLWKNARVK